MTTQELFVKYHWKQTIILGVVTLMAVSIQVASEEILINKNKTGKVLGVTTQQIKENITDQTDQNILLYQNNVKQIIKSYLKQRSTFTGPHQNWLFLINKTKQELILLTTPEEYKDLHTKLIILLDTEKKAVRDSNLTQINDINNRWDQLLKQFWWLK